MNQVYKITNKINDKVYVGITTQGANRRWSEHLYRFNSGERDHKIYLAMKKYGIENFELSVIDETGDPEKLSGMEIRYIQKYDSFNNGYNMTCGGEFISEETREKLRQINKGRNITWGDKIVATKRRRYEKWPCGRISGADSKMAKTYIVKHPNGKREVICGLRQFSRENNLSHNLLIATLKGIQTHHKGYVLLQPSTTSRKTYAQASGSGGYPVALAG